MKLLFFIIISVESATKPSSFLEHNKDKSLKTWIDWKNSGGRYDTSFSELPNTFSPETENYSEGLFMKGIWGLPCAVVSALLVVGLLLGRNYFGVLGGRPLTPEELTKQVKWTPGVLLVASWVLFMAGGITLLLASDYMTDYIEEASETTEEHTHITHRVLKEMKKELIGLNIEFGADPKFEVGVNWLEGPIKEADSMQSASKHMKEDLRSIDKPRVKCTLFLFCGVFMLYIVGFLAYEQRTEKLMYSVGVFLGINTVVIFLVGVLYSMELVGAVDFSEKVVNCFEERPGQGLGYYYWQFSEPSLESFSQLEASLARNVEYLYERIGDLTSVEVSSYSELKAVLPLIPDEQRTWNWIETLEILINAVKNTKTISSGNQFKSYCTQQEEVCLEFINSEVLAFVGLCILLVSFSLGFIGGLLAPRVLEKLKLEEQKLLITRQNLYGM